MFLNDPEDHREAQAGPLSACFGRDKGLKDFREDIGRNSVSGIRDGQPDVLRSFTDGSHTHDSALHQKEISAIVQGNEVSEESAA